MERLMDIKTASFNELSDAFRRHVGGLGLAADVAHTSSAIGCMLIEVWCWMRDGHEVEASFESLDFVTRQDGVSRLTQFVKRRDVPKDLIVLAERVLNEFGEPREDGVPLRHWVDTLHRLCMSSFAAKLGR